MMATVFIEPHERHEAIEAYKDRLTPEDVDQILDAPDEALISLRFGGSLPATMITIFEEG